MVSKELPERHAIPCDVAWPSTALDIVNFLLGWLCRARSKIGSPKDGGPKFRSGLEAADGPAKGEGRNSIQSGRSGEGHEESLSNLAAGFKGAAWTVERQGTGHWR